MKLLHCGDFHLDAKMETGLDSTRARERRVELLLTFSRTLEMAAELGCRAVLLAGDLFDTSRASEKTRRYVGEAIASHPELLFLSVAGNHDGELCPLFPNDTVPDHYHAFPADAWASVSLGEGVVVSGTAGIDRAGLLQAVPAVAPNEFHIVLLHGQLTRSAEMGESRIPLRLLQNRGIDHLALGHEHSFRCEALDTHGLWCYAGCPEGRGFDECGQKGCALIDTDKPLENRVQFIPLAKRTLHEIRVALDGCTSFGEIMGRVELALNAIPDEDMVKLVLCGEVSPELNCDTLYLQTVLKDRFYFSRIKQQTTLLLRPEDYQNDISLKGEFIRTVLASTLSDEQKQQIILCGLRALRGEEVDA